MIKIVSWNVNGLRAIVKKNFLDWFRAESPDILCLQETKLNESQIPEELREIEGYHSFYDSAERKGYSGVCTFTKAKPLSVSREIGVPEFETEGRILITEYPDFILLNIYFPNGGASDKRLDFKLRFYDAFLDNARALLNDGRPIIVCGDVNTAHKAIDLARPDENSKVSGFLPIEREWIDRFIEAGFVDTFRLFEDSGDHYSWWSYRTRARSRNIGWRIDYFFIDKAHVGIVKQSSILAEVEGSDHCPISLVIDVEK